MIQVLCVMIGCYVVSRLVDQIAACTEARAMRGPSIMFAIVAIGIASSEW
jgi:hypothetical protein